jgi:hypothetical protein
MLAPLIHTIFIAAGVLAVYVTIQTGRGKL